MERSKSHFEQFNDSVRAYQDAYAKTPEGMAQAALRERVEIRQRPIRATAKSVERGLKKLSAALAANGKPEILKLTGVGAAYLPRKGKQAIQYEEGQVGFTLNGAPYDASVVFKSDKRAKAVPDTPTKEKPVIRVTRTVHYMVDSPQPGVKRADAFSIESKTKATKAFNKLTYTTEKSLLREVFKRATKGLPRKTIGKVRKRLYMRP